MKNVVIYFLATFLLLACESDKSTLKKLSWLKGSWKANVEGMEVNETWGLQGDSIWIGKSAFFKDGNELFNEVMSIHSENDKMHFNSAASDQNNAENVLFKETSWVGKKIIFENKNHDFPQVIAYQLKSENEILAYISGTLNGEKKRMDFNFKRVK